MTGLTARDLMTPDVVTVPPETPVMAMARLLVDPAGGVLGIVTEADLIRRLAGEEDKPSSWFGALFADPASQAERFARTHGVTAKDLMTEKVVSVTPDTTAAHIAHMMEEQKIRRVVVQDGDKLCGIVSRADLLRALVAPPHEEAELSDERIRRAVMAAMKNQPWTDTFYTMVEVEEGKVTFHGFRRSDAVQKALRVLAENIPGVKAVEDDTQPMPIFIYGAA